MTAQHERRGDHCHECSKELCEIVPWPCPVEQEREQERGQDR